MPTRDDADPWADVPDGAPRRLLEAALDCFAEQGFHATTTRDIAQRAGMSPAAVYIHYASKAELLFRISLAGHGAALHALEHVPAELPVAERLRLRVVAFADWHVRNHRLARVVQYELGALEPQQFEQIQRLRQRIARVLQQEIAAGVEDGVFAVDDVRRTSAAVASLCIDIARWYTPGRARGDRSLPELYGSLALRMLGHRA